MRGRVFVPDSGFEKELLSSQQMADALLPLAQEAARVANTIAPRRTGEYIDAIVAVAGLNEDGVAVGRILNTDFKAHWIEYGSGPSRTRPKSTPEFAPLRRAVQQVTGRSLGV